MNTKRSTEQAVMDALAAQDEATVDEVAAAVGIGRTSTRKYLAALEHDGKVKRTTGGREGRRKLPDRFSPVAGEKETPSPEASAKAKGGRLRPGELDGLVLAYMRKHKEEGPLTASAIGKGIERSSGAVANCLARQGKAEKLRQVGKRPRTYEIAS